ncbi:helix-turn-helix domain-containing protein [Pseudoclavibacter sp. CFCC 11306]|uniref:helix-turn-helix domain-containing protein n=1 Tax=Pseudoclavibacter sp. CFCC 11306 TaxID=1564493 RepID=UPI0013012643|nr:helix-turn-helix transcriptional regulator [Pseudoclavibacter sp. CFCC 11306]KAB1657709.1 helix-turn-helix transcriptional regulator [Pseudoclavibacter sp. CFCC 11306]
MSEEPHSEAARIVGSCISELRRGRGISQQDLGELVGIHFTNIGKIERGLANPTLVRISVALEIDPSELVRDLGSNALPAQAHQLTVSDLIAARQGQSR